MRSLFQNFIYTHYSLTSSLGGGYLVKMWAPWELQLYTRQHVEDGLSNVAWPFLNTT